MKQDDSWERNEYLLHLKPEEMEERTAIKVWKR